MRNGMSRRLQPYINIDSDLFKVIKCRNETESKAMLSTVVVLLPTKGFLWSNRCKVTIERTREVPFSSIGLMIWEKDKGKGDAV